ncbi:PrsW family intramembrane metalloprotease [Brachybacterium endophyticum]|uniref:PrsW family intramembrane metalloprotease n=1 Tax=Brachybacterium endophyticum TaxID=2182385 RepID=UPI001F0C2EEB|nr:PrsW family intramembrane metalloprotease [Brachybacterium endophyticum]
MHYELPRLYDTSARPAGALTRARYAPAPMQAPQDQQPASAWSTQTRRIQQVQQQKPGMPVPVVLGWILAVLLGFALLVVLSLLFLLYVLGGADPAAWILQAILAAFSLLVIVGVIVLADRWDPQPLPLLLCAVLWGAAVAAGTAYIVNSLIMILAYSAVGDESIAMGIGAVLGAPFVEETMKGLGLVVLFLLGRRYFNGPLDGLVYGALIGEGFAFTENITYYGDAWNNGQVGGIASSVVIRGVIGIFGHAIYTSLTGVIMGLVARKWGTLPGVLIFLVATWPGMFLHFAWNGSATLFPSLGALLIMLIAEFALSALWLGLIAVLVFDESRLTRVRLGEYANMGWLTHEEVTMLGTWKGRREGRAWARSIGALPAMKRFIKEAAALAATRQRLLADGASPRAITHERDLLGRLTSNRSALLTRA